MSNSKPDSVTTPGLDNGNPMMEWWSQQWMQGINPMTRMQLAWMESVSEVMHQEALFLKAMAEASERLAQCYDTHNGDPSKVSACYQNIAKEMADHQMQRMHHVANLPNDFRQRIWEEI
ncbi:hypothetical protein HOP52_04460 [Halomonas campisalis]|uniref:Phasin domain-containing protein n=1 Tax=Billgrantia campisalis TaxID=74661 RepID=A0ABS9P5H1_9GAMM|nr:hypothetical protein [Halomonas campisalis]MCG6657028.1 hypothetical protein [Halomonas campisalis]MDR5862213.1 hypothetical protein [Halomonas campisalis]